RTNEIRRRCGGRGLAPALRTLRRSDSGRRARDENLLLPRLPGRASQRARGRSPPRRPRRQEVPGMLRAIRREEPADANLLLAALQESREVPAQSGGRTAPLPRIPAAAAAG